LLESIFNWSFLDKTAGQKNRILEKKGLPQFSFFWAYLSVLRVKIKFTGGEKYVFATHQKGAKASDPVIRKLLFVFEYCEKAAKTIANNFEVWQ
jgi:hypothetical protein